MIKNANVDEAFEYFYSLGAGRSMKKVGEHFHVTLRTVQNWAKTYNWRMKLDQRDVEIAKKMGEKTTNAILNEKANFRKDIKAAMAPIRDILSGLIKKVQAQENPIKVSSAKDYKDLLLVYKELVRLDLLLVGEATDKTEHQIQAPKTFVEWLIKEEETKE